MRLAVYTIALAILKYGNKFPELPLVFGILGIIFLFMDVVEFLKNIKII